MTSVNEGAEHLTGVLREFMRSVRQYVGTDHADDPVDRVIAAITVGIAAVMIAWPSGRKLPKIAQLTLSVARALWSRRAWWVDHP